MVSCLGAGSGLPVASFDCLAKAESALQASGLAYTILRPAPLLDDLGALMRQAVAGKTPVFWAKGDAQVRPVTARDVAIYAMACLDHPSTLDSIVPLCGRELTTGQTILGQLATLAGVEKSAVQTRNGWAASRSKSLALGRRWANRIAEERALWDGELCVDSSAWLDALGIPLQDLGEGVSSVLKETHPSEDPISRDTRVVHRQFQATVYTPGEIHQSELPDGPLRLI
jgi:nucleoside-diphosphate-sugar epimerase